MGLDFDQLYPARFLKAGEFAGKEVTLTVAGVTIEELEGDKGKQSKGILSFKETPKLLVLNKTNGLCIKGMFGRDTGAWIGKRLTLFPAPIDFGDSEIAIRVKGSPDIAAPVTFELKLARKKARQVTMQKTGQAPTNGKAAAPKKLTVPTEVTPAPNEPPADMLLPGQPGYVAHDPETGEVPFT